MNFIYLFIFSGEKWATRNKLSGENGGYSGKL